MGAPPSPPLPAALAALQLHLLVKPLHRALQPSAATFCSNLTGRQKHRMWQPVLTDPPPLLHDVAVVLVSPKASFGAAICTLTAWCCEHSACVHGVSNSLAPWQNQLSPLPPGLPQRPISVGTVARSLGSFECMDLRIVQVGWRCTLSYYYWLLDLHRPCRCLLC